MEKPLAHDFSNAQLRPGDARRRTQRVMVGMAVSLEAVGGSQTGAVAGVTVSVNSQGAVIQSSRTFAGRTLVELLNNRTGQKQVCRVTRAPVETQQGYLVTVQFVAPAPGYWHISFPPTDWKPFDD